MECGKLTAKLRDAVPVCFIVDGKEVKRYKNIEIPDEIKKLPFKAFDFNVPLTGAITFKISFEPGVLPEVWPEKRQRKSRAAKAAEAEIPANVTEAIQNAAPKKAMKKKPRPAITRNTQNMTGTLGTVDHAAFSICSGVAFRGSATKRFKSSA